METHKYAIKDISSGGPTAHGHEIEFTVRISDRDPMTFTCRADQLPNILETLRQYGKLADRLRASQPGDLVEVVTPITIKKVARAGHADDGKTVALDLATEGGFPIQLAMPPDQARRTIELLEAELKKLPKGKAQSH